MRPQSRTTRFRSRYSPGAHRLRHRLRVVHAPAPDAAAGVLQHRPQPRVRRQRRVRRQVRPRRPPRQLGRPPRRRRARRSRRRPGRRCLPACCGRSRSGCGRRRAACRSGRRPAPPGETWPMHAPVETPLNRASVSTATCLPHGRYFKRRRHLVRLLHPAAHRPAAAQHQHVARHAPCFGPSPLIAAIAAFSVVNTFAGPTLRYTPSASTTDGSIAVDLMTDAVRAQVAARERHRAGQAARLRLRRRHDDRRPGRRRRASCSRSRSRCAALGLRPPVEDLAERLAGRRSGRRGRAGPARAGAASPRARRRPGRRGSSGGRPGRSAAHRPAAAPGG